MNPPKNVDGIQKKSMDELTDEELQMTAKATKRLKGAILFLVGVPYIAFMGWAGFLLMILPSPAGAFEELKTPGIASAGIFGLFLIGVFIFGINRVMKKKVASVTRVIGIIRLVGFVAPGLILAGLVPTMITKEPPLSIQIADPATREEMIAPLVVTFNMDLAVDLLSRRGLRPVKYVWDFDGDGEPNDETLEPTAQAVYEKSGNFTLKVILELNNGSKRFVRKTVSIPKAVFSYVPERPGVDEVIKFSVLHLVDDPKEIQKVKWDFDDDGITDITTDLPEAAHTFLRTGTFPVKATVELSNQSQKVIESDVIVYEPKPPPFPVSIVSEPETLVSPAPFGTIFKVESDVAIESVIWDFGDGTKARGNRIGHNFEKRGVYQVKARIHAESGEVAELQRIVRVVDSLKLKDLYFEGTPEVLKNNTLKGEVPVTVDLVAKTSLPLIDFKWEAPGATSIGSTEGQFQAIYRRPGDYNITLIAQDPDGKVSRTPIKLTVEPPSSNVSIHMTPEGGVAPLLVFFDASETVIPNEEITGFEWSFGEKGGAVQQRGARVEHLFTKNGTFKIELTALTTSGKDFSASKTIVVRAPVLDACVLPSRTSGKAPLGVSFSTSCSTGNPTSVKWDFGDGSESDEKSPIHVFDEAGVYHVKLHMEDDLGTKSTATVTITAQ